MASYCCNPNDCYDNCANEELGPLGIIGLSFLGLGVILTVGGWCMKQLGLCCNEDTESQNTDNVVSNNADNNGTEMNQVTQTPIVEATVLSEAKEEDLVPGQMSSQPDTDLKKTEQPFVQQPMVSQPMMQQRM